ncbi:MAG: hypothetical protein HYY06_22720 [Deltaproteobacteria bacterium]|nr:hypothetical protein [Deltaproteobacteria bacterium]
MNDETELLERLRDDGCRLQEALLREHTSSRSGLGPRSGFAAIYSSPRFAWLSAAATFRRVRELRRPPEAASIAPLAEWISENVESAAARELTDRLDAAEAEATALVGGEEVGYRDLPGRIRNTRDRALRAELFAALERLWRELDPLAADALALGRDAIASLGLGDYATALGDLAGFDVRALAREADAFLARTEDVYRESLADALRRGLELPLRQAAEHDLWAAFRLRAHDGHFRADEMVWRVEGFLGRMGIDPTASGRIRRDVEDRPGKTPRAFCAPIRVPDEVVLVIRPSGGMNDYRSFLHEYGHALHHANTSRSLPFEERALGDCSVTEAYAFTLDRLTIDRVFLNKVMKLPRSATELPARELQTSNLFVARRQAAKLCYEIELHAGATDPVDRYRRWLSRASGVPVSGARHALDVDRRFYAARYLRAWLLEAVLVGILRDRFDEDWFHNPRAGAFLASLWAEGNGKGADGLAASLGARLNFETLALRFEEVLR